jgi:tRNA nucleotidyltransferase (CCA-adding enzyme)
MDHIIAKLKNLFPERLHSWLFLVGGMVRDILLGVECQDIDLVAAIPPQDLSALGFRLVESKSTPNIYFWFSKELGKVEVTWISTKDALLEDLKRRDFTINAMAMTLDQVLYDPLGGAADLDQRVLRTCSATSLIDDPARIFRAFRFECDGWRLDKPAQLSLSGRDWSDELKRQPIERFSQEMLKALAKPDPSRFFRRMLQFGIGEALLPEIFRMPEVPAGPLQYHPEGDLFTHSMQVLERMALSSSDPTARFCALFHDLGKLSTPKELYPKHHGHDQAGYNAAPALCKRLRLPAALRRALQATSKLHDTANRWHELRDSTKILLALDALKAGIAHFLPLIVAADCGGAMPGWEKALMVAGLNSAQLGIDLEAYREGKDFKDDKDNKDSKDDGDRQDGGDGQGTFKPSEKLQQIIMQRRVAEFRKG